MSKPTTLPDDVLKAIEDARINGDFDLVKRLSKEALENPQSDIDSLLIMDQIAHMYLDSFLIWVNQMKKIDKSVDKHNMLRGIADHLELSNPYKVCYTQYMVEMTQADVEEVINNFLLKRFDAYKFHPEIITHCRELYGQGHYFHAVFEAAKVYNNLVKSKARSTDDGESLMLRVWSSNKGVLKITLSSSETDTNFQDGVKFLSAGLMRAVRNPTAHEPALDWPIDEQDATDILSLVSFLLRQHDKAIYSP